MFKKRNIVLKLEAMKQNNIKKIQSVMPLKLATSLCVAALFGLTGCSVDNGLTLQEPISSESLAINSVPTNNLVRTFTTTADGVNLLRQDSIKTLSGVNMAPTTIELDPALRMQTMEGFGYAITYSTAYNLLKMSAADRASFLKKTFSPTAGYGSSYVRISIGCSDFSSTVYTLCDKQGLENFALQNDETHYVIPVLKEILAINPDLKIIASPWTCPRWMKVSDIVTKQPHNKWTDGHLNPDYRSDYAQYFVKFVQAMKQQGINIYAVTPQNEPLNPGNCASTYMPWQEEAPFVKELARAFKSSGLGTKIYVYDHNYDYANGQDDYPVKVYDALGSTYDGSELVVGAAFHDYGGSNTELTDIYEKAPGKGLIFSESSIGTWNNGHDLSKRLVADMKNVVLGTVNKMCKAVIVWNLMLDTKMGPNLAGGCQTCFGAVDISTANYKTLTYNSHYYVISQIASVVKPGAVRLGLKKNIQNANIMHSEFLNPDGSYAAVLLNTGDRDQQLTLSDGNHHFQITIPTNGVVSARWK